MPTSKQYYGVKGDECQCGRRESVRHCPSCGSVRSYARMNRYHKFVDGIVKLVDNEFRCQGCGHLFVDAERVLCEAPPIGEKLAAQKVRALQEVKQSGEYISPNEAKMLRAVETLTNPSVSKLSPEQREELEAKLDVQLRGVWAELVIACQSNPNLPEPGPCVEWVAEQKKKFFITDDGQIKEVPSEVSPQ